MLIFYTQHAEVIFKCSYLTARKKVNNVLESLKESNAEKYKNRDFITIDEFCKYYALNVDDVLKTLKFKS